MPIPILNPLQIDGQLAKPSDPDASSMLVWARKLSATHGFALPRALTMGGVDLPFLPGVGGDVHPIFIINKGTSTGVPDCFGGVLTTAGTFESDRRTLGGANKWLRMRKTETITTTAASNAASIRLAYTGPMSRGDNGNEGGFFSVMDFGVTSVVASSRVACGFTATTGALAGDPSAHLNCLLVGYDAADTEWKFMYNDGSGTATKVSVGDRSTHLGLRFAVLMPPGSGTAYVRIVSLVDDSLLLDSSYSSNVPAADTGLAWKCDVQNASTGVACTVCLAAAVIYVFQRS
jgi:hypothetical protein